MTPFPWLPFIEIDEEEPVYWEDLWPAIAVIVLLVGFIVFLGIRATFFS